MRTKILAFLFALFSYAVLFAGQDVDTVRLQTAYPHWNLTDPTNTEKLLKIDDFINANKDKGELAVFDWDGTLYNEMIPCKENNNILLCGQAGYLIWTAVNKSEFSFEVFPTYKTDAASTSENIINMINFLEGKTNATQENPAHTFLYGTMFAGMTPMQISETAQKYLQAYRVKDNMFYPEFDVLQKMIDSGFNVFIMTGSNEYLVSTMLNEIESIPYKGELKYNFPSNLSGIPYSKETGHIIGNSPLLNGNVLSNVDDYSWTKNDKGDLYVVDGYGKKLACENLEKKFGKSVIFVAGNSNGDFYDMGFVADKKDTLSIAINPRGADLPGLVKQHPENILVLSYKY